MKLKELKKDYDELKEEVDKCHSGFKYPIGEYVEELEQLNAEMLEVLSGISGMLGRETEIQPYGIIHQNVNMIIEKAEGK